MKTIRIEVLYPELNHLYGDTGNIAYLTAKLDLMGVPYEIISTNLKDEPAFVKGDIDFLYIGPSTESYQKLEAEALQAYRDALIERMNSDAVTLMTGNAFELLGEYIEEESGEKFPALSIIPTYAKRFTRLRFNDLDLGEWNGIEIVGFKNQLSHTYLLEGASAPDSFLSMKFGCGLNPQSKDEGFSKNMFFATYLIGPVLPLNPLFTAEILKALCPEVTEIPEMPYEMDAYNRRLADFKSQIKK